LGSWISFDDLGLIASSSLEIVGKLLRWTLIVVVALAVAAGFIANATRRRAESTLMPDARV
jgi:hypothetical protein